MFDSNEKILLIHIGMGKTGTSSLQMFCDANREALLQQGWFYPHRDDLDYAAGPGNRGNFTDIARVWRRARDNKNEAEIQTISDSLVSTLAKIEAPAIFLSTEWLFSMHDSFWSEITPVAKKLGRRLVILAYIREQREWILSAYSQRVKSQGWSLSAQEYLEKTYRTKTLNFLRRYASIRKSVGSENIIFRRFQKATLVGADVCRDFVDVIRANPESLSFSNEFTAANRSQGVVTVELMRILNELTDGTFNTQILMKKAALLDLPNSGDLYRLVDPQVMRKIGKTLEASNNQLRKILFPAETGPLFQCKIPDTYEQYRPEELINRQTIQLLLTMIRTRKAPKVREEEVD